MPRVAIVHHAPNLFQPIGWCDDFECLRLPYKKYANDSCPVDSPLMRSPK